MMRAHVHLALAFFFFALGAVGAALPVLPTTPFLLLAAYFFARGSPRFNAWFASTRLYKRYLERYATERGMTLRTKLVILFYASTMLILAFLAMKNVYGRAAIVLALAFKYYYFFFKIRTLPRAAAERAGTRPDSTRE